MDAQTVEHESKICAGSSKLGTELSTIQDHLKKLEDEVLTWPHVSVHSHRFGGREYLFDEAEVGHVHTGVIVDIPFPLSVRDALLANGLAEEHHWVPNWGWITFNLLKEDDLKHALSLADAVVISAVRTEESERAMFMS